MFEKLNSESMIILQLVSKKLFGKEVNIDWSTVDLKALYEEAKGQAVIAITFEALPKEVAAIDVETYKYWQNMSFRIVQSTLINNMANVKLTQLLEKNSICHSTIKGYSSAYYYPNPTNRQMGDIDFIVNKKDIEVTKRLLIENGFVVVEDAEEHDFHIGFIKDKMIYEMHWDVTELPEEKAHLLSHLDNLVESAKKVKSSCGEIIIPNEVHHAISMLLHIHRHLVDGYGIGLRHLCDWAVLVEAFSNEEWMQKFEVPLKAMGLWKFAMAISKVCCIYLNITKKDWFEDVNGQIVESLLYDFLHTGNFGRKDSTQKTQQKFFFDLNQQKANILVRVIKEINFHVCDMYPFFKKAKILLPVGFLIYIFRMFILVISGKKQLNVFKVYKEGKENLNLYSSFDFFEEQK